MADEQTRKPRSGRLRAIVGLGIVIILGNLAYIGWVQGYFKPKEKIALVTWNQDPYWGQVIAGANDAAKEFNVDLTVIRSDPDEKIQSQHIRDLLDGGIQGIAVSPNNPATQAPLLNEVADKAMLVTFDSDAPVSKRKGFVGTDNYAAGQLCGEEVRGAIPDGGEAIISVGSIDMINGRERRQGLIDDLMDRHSQENRAADPVDAVLKGAKYTIDTTVLDYGDSAKATALVTDAIKAHPNVKCIVGLFSYSAPAVVKAIEAAGKQGQIKIIGFDELDETQAGVQDGTIYSSILQDQYRCGYETVLTLVEALRGINQQGPSGPRIIPMRVWVMRASNIKDLRIDKMVHLPAAKPAT
jgi:ribose transport system substrate-binding protein